MRSPLVLFHVPAALALNALTLVLSIPASPIHHVTTKVRSIVVLPGTMRHPIAYFPARVAKIANAPTKHFVSRIQRAIKSIHSCVVLVLKMLPLVSGLVRQEVAANVLLGSLASRTRHAELLRSQDLEKNRAVQDLDKSRAVQGLDKSRAVQDLDKSRAVQGLDKILPVQDPGKNLPVQDQDKSLPVQDQAKNLLAQNLDKSLPGTFQATHSFVVHLSWMLQLSAHSHAQQGRTPNALMDSNATPTLLVRIEKLTFAGRV